MLLLLYVCGCWECEDCVAALLAEWRGGGFVGPGLCVKASEVECGCCCLAEKMEWVLECELGLLVSGQ